jgi:hypothetical protein
MPNDPIKSTKRLLEPNERILEVLFWSVSGTRFRVRFGAVGHRLNSTRNDDQ